MLRAMSRRLAATLHGVETTENVALPCLGGLRKSATAENDDAPLDLLRLRGTLHAGLMAPCSNMFLLNMIMTRQP